MKRGDLTVTSINNEINEMAEDLKPSFKNAGFRLVEFSFANMGQAGGLVLRFLVDRAVKETVRDGVTHGDCIAVTKIIESEIEKRPSFQQIDYSIEVSSPGVNRPFLTLEDYEVNIGFEIVIKLRNKILDHNKLTGILREVRGGDAPAIVLEVTGTGDDAPNKVKGPRKASKLAGKIETVPVADIAKASIKIQF